MILPAGWSVMLLPTVPSLVWLSPQVSMSGGPVLGAEMYTQVTGVQVQQGNKSWFTIILKISMLRTIRKIRMKWRAQIVGGQRWPPSVSGLIVLASSSKLT